jgi:lysozyme family protein
MCAERLQFMHSIRGGSAWQEFGGGWGSRVADLKAYCDHLALGGAAPTAPDLTHVAMPKVKHVAKTAGAPTAGGVIASGTAAHEAGFNWYVVGGIVVATIAAGVIYEVIQAKKTSTANNTVILPPVPLPVIPAVPAVAVPVVAVPVVPAVKG